MGEGTPLIASNEYEEQPRYKNFHLILICLFSLCFLSSADSTMVSTLLGQMAHDLKAQDRISWVATSYLLSCATFQPLFGKLSDVFGRKRMILICINLFTLGCFICGAASRLEILVMGRFITGIGGGGLSSLVTIAMSDLVSLKERGLYGGYIGVFLDLGAISGGVLAGIVDQLWGWQWAFWGQVPLCILIAILIWNYFDLKEEQEVHHWIELKGLDWVGSFLLTTSLFSLLVITSTNIDETIWYSLVGYCLIGFPVFYWYEGRIDNAIIPVELLHNPTIFITCINWWFMCSNFYTYVFYLPFYWSSVQNRTSFQCGYLFTPSTIISTCSALFTGWILKHNDFRPIHLVGGILIAFGGVLLYMINPTTGLLGGAIISLPLRFGTSINHSVNLIAMLASVPKEQQALVTSIQYGFKSMGSTMGIGIANAILQSTLDFNLEKGKNIEPPLGWSKDDVVNALQRAKQDPQLGWTLPPKLQEIVIEAYDLACHDVFKWLLISGFVCLLMVWLTPIRRKPFSTLP